MKRIITLIVAMAAVITVNARKFTYDFHDTPISQALVTLTRDHDDLNISFIYKELDKYKTSASINTDEPFKALNKIIGLNPITLIEKNGTFYIEALQHGKYVYTGRAMGTDSEPVIAATVMLLSPIDSTVITYGITDNSGRFSIPCDRRNVLAKLSCLGYRPTYRMLDTFNAGTIIMPELATKLGELKVEADNAHLYADRSIYIPTSRQKKASLSGTDLLDHMAIPQLGLISGDQVSTNAGKPVAIFIDYIPASENDLQALRTEDVKRVEYYEFPSDPRLQGNPYVVNFIMQKYEYGGYFKTMGHTNLISNPAGVLLANLRLQRKSMTYDILGSTFHYDRKHEGSELTETYRLPQPSGEVEEFQRFSNTTSARQRNHWYFAALKATYNSDAIQAASQIKGRIDSQPKTERMGNVTYTSPDISDSEYYSLFAERSKFIAYEGYYHFRLPSDNSLTFNPEYSYSYTERNTEYIESGYPEIKNGASDNTNKFSGNLKFVHKFGNYGNLSLGVNGSYEYNRTRYSGASSALDKAKSSRLEAGIRYDINAGKVYAAASFAWDWDRLQFGEMIDKPSTPKANVSLQYAPDDHNSMSLSASYESWLPSPSYKSDVVIEATPFLKYTGNPNLFPAKSYDFDFTYTWIPNNNYSLSAFAWGWIVGDRYVYDYEATSTGILRTIKQPMGSFAQCSYGINGTARFLDRSLVFSERIGHLLNHNGRPYDVNHSHINWYARARYYLGNWNFTLTYTSPNGTADGCMNGLWVYDKSTWYITIGWSDSHWNIRGDIINFTRWNYRNAHYVMRSKYYDTDEIKLGGQSRAWIQLVATYTFGFGKKVKRDDEPSVSGSASSGILQ